MTLFVCFCAISVTALFSLNGRQNGRETQQIGMLQSGGEVTSVRSDGATGIAIRGAGSASAEQMKPVQLEFDDGHGKAEEKSAGYDSFEANSQNALGLARVAGPGGSSFAFRDEWSMRGNAVELSRTIRVSGTNSSGFLSSFTFSHPAEYPRSSVEYFAPGMIYGSTAHLTASAIGGQLIYEGNGHGQVRIREDRLPAPMFGVRFPDGTALTVLDPEPDGETTREDSHDIEVRTMTDERFRFGAIGADLDGGRHEQGFWFPGSEGEVTYRGNTYPGGQVHEWRRRYHPIRDGLIQQYRILFRFSKETDFPTYVRDTWRWAYQTLNPPITWQDIPAAERSNVQVLANQVQVRGDRSGIPNFVPSVPGSDREPSQNAILGFTGKNLEAAEFLLEGARLERDQGRAAEDRKLGLAIFSSFLKLKMNPPVAEGFNIDTGEPALAIPRDGCVFLRSFGDGMKAILRAYRREKKNGIKHEDWLVWAKSFGDWLLTQQQSGGGFPRSWKPVTGAVDDPSPLSSYNPIPFLVLLGQETGDPRYLRAAERSAEFVWQAGQSQGKFVGGTIDNPDVFDKEADTLSIEAYLALYEATHEKKWLERARAAADYAETWIYIWNVPMPIDGDNQLLQWKKGVPTYGTQLIASGHSLVDDYMSFDVDEYAELGEWTNDPHYLQVSKLLLHDTKNMLALPGRTFDLKGPGWEQEHFSFAPVRGFGLHRLWLPWVATSQLNGIFELNEFDPLLFKQWTGVVLR